MTQGSKPLITITPRARAAFEQAGRDAPGECLHLEVSPRYEFDLYFAPVGERETTLEVDGLRVALDTESLERADGVSIDFVETANGAGFQVKSPFEPPRVKQIGPRDLQSMMNDGAPLYVFDVRTTREREIASIAGTVLLDAAGEAVLRALPRDARVVFQCHHGGRSQMAAERSLREGFTHVHNLAGGIEAWSLQVDPRVPRY